MKKNVMYCSPALMLLADGVYNCVASAHRVASDPHIQMWSIPGLLACLPVLAHAVMVVLLTLATLSLWRIHRANSQRRRTQYTPLHLFGVLALLAVSLPAFHPWIHALIDSMRGQNAIDWHRTHHLFISLCQLFTLISLAVAVLKQFNMYRPKRQHKTTAHPSTTPPTIQPTMPITPKTTRIHSKTP